MGLFQIQAYISKSETSVPRVWFIIAGNLLEAMSLIPMDFAVTKVEVQPIVLAKLAHVVGWVGQPVIDLIGHAHRQPRIGGDFLAAETTHGRVEPWTG